MTPGFAPKALRLAALVGLAGLVAGCNALTRLSEVGTPPKLSEVESPTTKPGYRPISMPMPTPSRMERQVASLWRPGARQFFKDNRAGEVGDILTVIVKISDKASLANKTEQTRDNSESLGVPSLLGFESSFGKHLPQAVDPSSLVDMSTDSTTKGDGKIDRADTVEVRVAALVTQVLPNGNLVIAGRQEVRVNYELRELTVSGVIRPSDITSENTINHDQVAEARVAYGGRGTLSDIQQPRYGQQILDIVLPF
ncbi:MAG: flagellar basal body L-ring protein FlgH [Proteobacteria bacterium]|nr:flagellar basal body L-ring protein FlgH [Pseudomonadota bacterium]